MQQKEFTDYIISRLIDRFPQFKGHITAKPNDVIDIDFKSNKEELTLWITTQDREITIGFTGDTECDWHTHMSLFGANTPDEELQAAAELIEGILNDKESIVHSNLKGYSLIDNLNEVENDLAKDEKVQVFKWSEL